MNKLSRRVQTLAAVAEETGCIGLGVEIEKECSIDDSKATMKDVKTVL